MTTIEFSRDDSYERGFQLKRNGEPDTTVFDEIYLTVKKRAFERNAMIQKRLTDGGIVSDGDGHYTVFFRPEDTDGLDFGEYVYDIEVRKDDFCRTLCVGKFIMGSEVTHRCNE